MDLSHLCQQWMLLQTVSWRSFIITVPQLARHSAAHAENMDYLVGLLLSVDHVNLRNVTIHITRFFFEEDDDWRQAVVGDGGSGVEWLMVLQGCHLEPWLPQSQCRCVLEQDIEPLIAPDVLAGALHGCRRHRCMNVCVNGWMWCTISVKRLG